MNKSKYNLILRLTICLIFVFLFQILLISNIVKAEYPCECKEDRTLELKDPLMKGNDVLLLQKRLKQLGYYKGSLDGEYGEVTYHAVKNFQHDFKLETNGITNTNTWNMIGNLSDSKITTRDGKHPEGELSILINLYTRTLILYSDGKPYKKYPVTIGKKETPSPVGEWYIKNKYTRVKDGPLGSRWMGLNVPWGVYGIHGTNKPYQIGVAASLGCIRLHNQYVEELFDWVDLDTRVKIVGPRPDVSINNILKPGNTGYDVMKLQEELRKRGFYTGYLDGRYSSLTGSAVEELEAQYRLKKDGITDHNIFEILQIEYNF